MSITFEDRILPRLRYLYNSEAPEIIIKKYKKEATRYKKAYHECLRVILDSNIPSKTKDRLKKL